MKTDFSELRMLIDTRVGCHFGEGDKRVLFAELDRLTDLLGSQNAQPDQLFEFIADFKKVRPDAHKHLSLFESYKTLAILFDQIGRAHVDISKRGGGVKGMSIDERVSSLLDRLAALGSLPVPDIEDRYRTMCRAGHQQIGFNGDGNWCPLCRALATAALLSRSAQEKS